MKNDNGNRGLSPNIPNIRPNIHLLYLSTFGIHIAWCLTIFYCETPQWVTWAREFMSASYLQVGFTWAEQGTTLFVAGIASGLSLNLVRRSLEGLLLGWPRYSDHGLATLKRSMLRAISYVAFVLLLVGVLGEKYQVVSTVPRLLGVAIATYALGLIVNVLDDFISSILFSIKEMAA